MDPGGEVLSAHRSSWRESMAALDAGDGAQGSRNKVRRRGAAMAFDGCVRFLREREREVTERCEAREEEERKRKGRGARSGLVRRQRG